MAATNSSTRRDVFTRVRRQHDTIRRLFDDVEAASPARRADAFQPLVRLLAVHETAEEMVVYPALLLAGSEARAVVRARRIEEDQAKKRLAVLEGLDAGSREFLAQLRAFRVEVEAHAGAEEAEVLALLDEHRPAHELRLMDLWFVTAETVAPTHAHRFAPESALGNLLLGPAVALVDRVRDMPAASPSAGTRS
jgi:Hemerythrin HHE cation binding domain